MTPESPLNDPALIATRDTHVARLTAMFAGEAQGPFYLSGLAAPPARGDGGPFDPEGYVRESLDWLARQTAHARDERIFRPLCVQFNLFATHFMDRVLGARVFFIPESGQWHNDYLPTPIGQLREPDLERDETWALARRAAETFLAAGVGLPIFALPTIASPLNVFVNLYGQEALMSFLSDPDAATHDLAVITRVSAAMHRWYLTRFPLAQMQPVLPATRFQPPGHGQVCGCSSQMLPLDLYRDFVAALDAEIIAVHPRGAGMIHLCGAHTQHLPAWRARPEFKALQLNGGALEEFDRYAAGLRADQVLYAVIHDEPPARFAELREQGAGRPVVFSSRVAMLQHAFA